MQSKMTSRRDQMMELRKYGISYAEIGRKYGITRERVRKILNPKPPKTSGTPIPYLGGIPQKTKLLLTTTEAANVLGIHRNTLVRWSDKGIIRVYRITRRGDRRYRIEDIDDFLKIHEQQIGD